jgi:hypothetical protein
MKANGSDLSFTSRLTLSPALPGPVRSYAELQQQIHHDLRVQHPEWVEPNGNSPICDSYERRLAELIGFFRSAEHKSLAA